jgi:hypothetical protein
MCSNLNLSKQKCGQCLVFCSMRLGVPFIAPRDLGAVGAPFGTLWLPYVRVCTGAHQTVNSAMTKNPLISYFLLLGGHQTVRWVAPCGGQISPGSTRRQEGLAKGFRPIISRGHPFVGQEETVGGMGQREKEADSSPSGSLDLSVIHSADPTFSRTLTLNNEAD